MKFIYKGKSDYPSSMLEMDELVLKTISGVEEEQVWFLEYSNLYTIGSSVELECEKINNVPVFKTNRGGKITFHGYGQIIIYFMIDLKKLFYPNQPDIKKFIWLLEEIGINSLKNIGLVSKRLNVNHGVWIENKKILAIGIRLKKWISSHGLALNFNTDLSFYDHIKPCGLGDNYGITSILNEIPNFKLSKEEFVQIMIQSIKEIFKNESVNYNNRNLIFHVE